PTDARHGVGLRFDHLAAGGTYRVTVWFKSAPNAWAMIEGRDSNDPVTGHPAHYGVASYDMAQATMTKSSGDLTNLSVALAKDGWVKAGLDPLPRHAPIYV